jgi:hypothetical protein
VKLKHEVLAIYSIATGHATLLQRTTKPKYNKQLPKAIVDRILALNSHTVGETSEELKGQGAYDAEWIIV